MLIKTFQKRFRVVDLNQNKTQDLPEESADIKKKKKRLEDISKTILFIAV